MYEDTNISTHSSNCHVTVTVNKPLTRSMQNLLPMRLVFVGASTPVVDGEVAAGLANVFKPKPADAFTDRSVSSSLLEALATVLTSAFTAVCLQQFLDISSCSVALRDTSEERLWCRLACGRRRGIVEDCSAASAFEMFNQHAAPVPGAELLKLHTYTRS